MTPFQIAAAGLLLGGLATAALLPFGREMIRRGSVLTGLAAIQLAALAAALPGAGGGWGTILAAFVAASGTLGTGRWLSARLRGEHAGWMGALLVVALALPPLLPSGGGAAEATAA